MYLDLLSYFLMLIEQVPLGIASTGNFPSKKHPIILDSDFQAKFSELESGSSSTSLSAAYDEIFYRDIFG